SNATVVAPELKRLGVPAAFFVVTSSLGGHTPFWCDRHWALRAKLGTLPQGLALPVLKQLPYRVLAARIEQACAQYGVEADLRNDDIFPMSWEEDRKSTRLNSSHVAISYAVFCLKKKKNQINIDKS